MFAIQGVKWDTPRDGPRREGDKEMLFFRLFRRVDPNCAYCRYGTRISERDVVCLKRGVVPVEHHCRAFRYDPLKRTPPRPAVLRLGGLGEADFSLEGAVPGQETLFAGMDGWASEPEAEGPENQEGPEAREASEPLEAPGTRAEIPEEPEARGELEEPEARGELEEPEAREEPETPEEPQTPEEPEVPETREAEGEGPPREDAAKKPVKVKVRAVRIRR